MAAPLPAAASSAATPCFNTTCIVCHGPDGRGTFHGVDGTITIVDNCTIEVEMFDYDGLGIDVRFYGALGSNFIGGFAIGPDLVRNTPYSAETLTFSLPANKSLDDMDSISVWCVDVAIRFGDAIF